MLDDIVWRAFWFHGEHGAETETLIDDNTKKVTHPPPPLFRSFCRLHYVHENGRLDTKRK